MAESFTSKRLDAVFHALADPTRRGMLKRLSSRAHTVGDLAAPYDMSLAAASKHIQVLERAGLVQREVQGRTHLCSLDARPLHRGVEWLRHYEQFWNTRLDALDALLRGEDSAAGKTAASAPARGKRSSVSPARKDRTPRP